MRVYIALLSLLLSSFCLADSSVIAPTKITLASPSTQNASAQDSNPAKNHLLTTLALPRAQTSSLQYANHVYVLDDINTPVILSFKDHHGKYHGKAFLSIRKPASSCQNLQAALKRIGYALSTKSIVYIAGNNQIKTIRPC